MADVVRLDGKAVELLRDYINRIKNLDEEKQTLTDDIASVYAEAKAAGFEVKAIRRIIADEKKDQEKLADFDAILDLYQDALGLKKPAPERKAREAAVKKAFTRIARKDK